MSLFHRTRSDRPRKCRVCGRGVRSTFGTGEVCSRARCHRIYHLAGL